MILLIPSILAHSLIYLYSANASVFNNLLNQIREKDDAKQKAREKYLSPLEKSKTSTKRLQGMYLQ